MAENSSKVKHGLNLIGVFNYSVLISALVVSLCALLVSTSISPIFFGIVVFIGLLIGVLCLMYFFNSKCMGNDHLLNVIIFCIRLWCSCVLGLMSFVDINDFQNNVMKAVTCMLLTSVGMKAIWLILKQYYVVIKYSSSTVTWTEMLQLVGFSVTGFVFLPEGLAFVSKYAFFQTFVSIAFTVMALRLKVFPNTLFGTFCVALFTVCHVLLFSTVDVPFNYVALGCFAGHLVIEPVFDFFFSNISIEDKLSDVFNTSGWLQKMYIVIANNFEVSFPLHGGVSVIYHNEWYWILPYIGILLFWIYFHSSYIHLCWKFSNKISECNEAKPGAKQKSNTAMDKMMAAKEIRLHAQLTRFLIAKTIGSILLLLIVTLIPSATWHKDKKVSLAASFLIMLLVEGVFYAASNTFWKLPGACTACIIMPPSGSNGQSELVKSGGLQKSIVKFFELHAIPFGSDSFINGLSVENRENQLQSFFQQTIPDTDGQRYDSYVVFCRGVKDDGEWQLTGCNFQFEMMQKLWNICNTGGFPSRLIVIQD